MLRLRAAWFYNKFAKLPLTDNKHISSLCVHLVKRLHYRTLPVKYTSALTLASYFTHHKQITIEALEKKQD